MASLLQHPFCYKQNISLSSGLTHRNETLPDVSLSPHCKPQRLHGAPLWHPRRQFVTEVRAGDDPPGSRSGENLWRNELLTQESSPSSWSEEELLIRAEEEAELEQQRQTRLQKSRTNKEDDDRASAMKILGAVIEKLLVADFFFILFILGWFLAGLAEKAAFDTSTLIDAWLPLWSPVFQPALGFFMAAALWSAVSKKFFNS